VTGTGPVPDSAAQTDLVVGLLASPGPAAELTAGLVAKVADRLAVQLPGVRWKVEFVIDRLVEPPTDLTEVISAGRRMLLDRGWQAVTALPGPQHMVADPQAPAELADAQQRPA
jgi:hypothetical protein